GCSTTIMAHTRPATSGLTPAVLAMTSRGLLIFDSRLLWSGLSSGTGRGRLHRIAARRLEQCTNLVCVRLLHTSNFWLIDTDLTACLTVSKTADSSLLIWSSER